MVTFCNKEHNAIILALKKKFGPPVPGLYVSKFAMERLLLECKTDGD